MKVIQVATLIFDKDTSTVPVAGGIGALLTYVGGVLALLLCSIVFAAAELTLLLLSVTAPIFIMCLMFGFLRQMFNSWLQLNFSSLLVFLFAALALRAGTWQLNMALSTSIATASENNLLQTGVTSLAAGIFMAWIIWQAKSYASQIAGVGVEGAMQAQPLWGLVLAFSVHPVWRVAHLVWAEMPVLVHGKVCVVRKAGLISLRE